MLKQGLCPPSCLRGTEQVRPQLGCPFFFFFRGKQPYKGIRRMNRRASRTAPAPKKGHRKPPRTRDTTRASRGLSRDRDHLPTERANSKHAPTKTTTTPPTLDCRNTNPRTARAHKTTGTHAHRKHSHNPKTQTASTLNTPPALATLKGPEPAPGPQPSATSTASKHTLSPPPTRPGGEDQTSAAPNNLTPQGR